MLKDMEPFDLYKALQTEPAPCKDVHDFDKKNTFPLSYNVQLGFQIWSHWVLGICIRINNHAPLDASLDSVYGHGKAGIRFPTRGGTVGSGHGRARGPQQRKNNDVKMTAQDLDAELERYHLEALRINWC